MVDSFQFINSKIIIIFKYNLFTFQLLRTGIGTGTGTGTGTICQFNSMGKIVKLFAVLLLLNTVSNYFVNFINPINPINPKNF